MTFVKSVGLPVALVVDLGAHRRVERREDLRSLGLLGGDRRRAPAHAFFIISA